MLHQKSLHYTIAISYFRQPNNTAIAYLKRPSTIAISYLRRPSTIAISRLASIATVSPTVPNIAVGCCPSRGAREEDVQKGDPKAGYGTKVTLQMIINVKS